MDHELKMCQDITHRNLYLTKHNLQHVIQTFHKHSKQYKSFINVFN